MKLQLKIKKSDYVPFHYIELSIKNYRSIKIDKNKAKEYMESIVNDLLLLKSKKLGMFNFFNIFNIFNSEFSGWIEYKKEPTYKLRLQEGGFSYDMWLKIIDCLINKVYVKETPEDFEEFLYDLIKELRKKDYTPQYSFSQSNLGLQILEHRTSLKCKMARKILNFYQMTYERTNQMSHEKIDSLIHGFFKENINKNKATSTNIMNKIPKDIINTIQFFGWESKKITIRTAYLTNNKSLAYVKRILIFGSSE